MEEGKQGVGLAPPKAAAVVAISRGGGNPLVQAQDWIKDRQEGFQAWMSKQPLHVEVAFATGIAAVQGALLGGLLTVFNKDLASSFPNPDNTAAGVKPPTFMMPEAAASNPFVQARNFAVLSGVNSGISCVLRRVRGVEDVQSSMAAAFGSGVMFSLVSGGGGPDLAGKAVATGAFFALAQGGIFKIGQMMTGGMGGTSSNEDLYYVRGRNMLTKLGLQKYEKNFRKGLLTDITLPLLTDSALRDVNIPPGPRLVILDHIQREPELTKGKRLCWRFCSDHWH